MHTLSASALVTFLNRAEGGRNHPAENSRKYRPHIVLGPKEQREAKFAPDSRTIIEPYLPTCFCGDGKLMQPGTEYEVKLVVVYDPNEPKFRAPEAGEPFTLREGGHVVGFGEILSINERKDT